MSVQPASTVMDTIMLHQELEAELHAIAAWWMSHSRDDVHGGCFGSIANDNTLHAKAPKGSVLHSRVLWTFSAFYQYTQNDEHRLMADHAYAFLIDHLLDKDFGGLYWTVDYKGNPLEDKKQVYATAFGIYALAQYHLATGHAEALKLAMELFSLLEQKAFDPGYGGYFDAFGRQWQPIADMRLSEKDANEAKTMNTHLHVLEAYTALYHCRPDGQIVKAIRKLLNNFFTYFINPQTHHLQLFFDAQWQCRGDMISYGHDIEAAWLLQEAAEAIGDADWINITKANAVQMAIAVQRGLAGDGALWYEFDPAHGGLVREKHWWPQAEAMVGFYNAWQVSGDASFAAQAINSWTFIKARLKAENGEWYWGIGEDGNAMPGKDKAGLWKCPYHNGRACLEMLKRLARS